MPNTVPLLDVTAALERQGMVVRSVERQGHLVRVEVRGGGELVRAIDERLPSSHPPSPVRSAR